MFRLLSLGLFAFVLTLASAALAEARVGDGSAGSMKITDWISALSLLFAALAFIFSIWKQREDVALQRQDAALQRELDTKRRWTEFMDMAFQNPDYSYDPDYCWKCKRKPGEKRPREDVLHKQFTSRFLFTAEEILEVFPNDKEWAEAIASQLTCHRHYFLEEMTDRQLSSYSEGLGRVIEDWRREVQATPEVNTNTEVKADA